MFRSALLVLLVSIPLRADEPTSFPAAKHGGGELRYVETVPVLTVRGTPEQMGLVNTLCWVQKYGSLPGSDATA